MQRLINLLCAAIHAAAPIKRQRPRVLAVLTAAVVTLVLATGAQGASAPALTLTPASLSFATQATGTTSAPLQTTATNSGSAPLFFNSVQVHGADPLDFGISDDQCSGVTLAAGASCTMAVTFSPTTTGARSANVVFTDNAANSPQMLPLSGGATGTAAPLAITTQFFACSNGVCDIANGSNVFVKNFFSTTFEASGGTPPYTWSGQVPAGLTLRPSGLVLGSPTSLGTTTFSLTVTDGAGTSQTGAFSLTVTPAPAPSPSNCQTGPTVKEPLSGAAIGGKTPSGQATADESKFSGCGGFSLLTVQVKDVNLPSGTVLWVALDGKPVGTITLNGGQGTMAQYNMGKFGVRRDSIQVFNSLPDASPFQQILSGGFFS